MKPSTFASFVIFIFHGSIVLNSKDYQTEPALKWILICVVFFSSLYYYYLSLIPQDLLLKDPNAKDHKKTNWIILVLQFIFFYLLWDSLKSQNWQWYSYDIFAINGTYLWWDILNKDNFKDETARKWIRGCDIAGVCLSIAYIFAIRVLPPHDIANNFDAERAMWLFVVSAFIIAQTLFGLGAAIYNLKHNPFKPLNND